MSMWESYGCFRKFGVLLLGILKSYYLGRVLGPLVFGNSHLSAPTNRMDSPKGPEVQRFQMILEFSLKSI